MAIHFYVPTMVQTEIGGELPEVKYFIKAVSQLGLVKLLQMDMF